MAPMWTALSVYDMRNVVKTVLTFRGTVLPIVICRFETWFFVGLHVACKYLAITSDGKGFIDMTFFQIGEEPWHEIAMISSMLSFFVIFIASQCYTRFVHLYDSCMAMAGTTQVIAAQASVSLEGQGAARWQGVRYLLAAVMIVYGTSAEAKTGGEKGIISEDMWERMLRPEVIKTPTGLMLECPAVLLPSEVTLLKGHAGNKWLLLLTWAMHVLNRGMYKAGCGVPLIGMMQTNVSMPYT